MMTSLTCSGFRPARSSTARITVAPRSGAAIFASDPPNLPTAVRAADTITTSVISISSGRSAACAAARQVKNLVALNHALTQSDAHSHRKHPRHEARSNLLSLPHITPRRRFDHREVSRAGRGARLHLLATVLIEPGGPFGPPAARDFGSLIEPFFRVLRQRLDVAVQHPE